MRNVRVIGMSALGALALAAIGACRDTTSACGGLPAPGFVVTVEDSATGAPTAAGAVLLLYDLEQSRGPVDAVTGERDDENLEGAQDRPGRYTVMVRKAGYQDWVKSPVTVRDGCPQVRTVRLTARLARS